MCASTHESYRTTTRATAGHDIVTKDRHAMKHSPIVVDLNHGIVTIHLPLSATTHRVVTTRTIGVNMTQPTVTTRPITEPWTEGVEAADGKMILAEVIRMYLNEPGIDRNH